MRSTQERLNRSGDIALRFRASLCPQFFGWLVGFGASLTTNSFLHSSWWLLCLPTRVTGRQHCYSTLIYFLNIASAMLYTVIYRWCVTKQFIISECNDRHTSSCVCYLLLHVNMICFNVNLSISKPPSALYGTSWNMCQSHPLTPFPLFFFFESVLHLPQKHLLCILNGST